MCTKVILDIYSKSRVHRHMLLVNQPFVDNFSIVCYYNSYSKAPKAQLHWLDKYKILGSILHSLIRMLGKIKVLLKLPSLF